MQHSRSSWDLKFPPETELPTTYYSFFFGVSLLAGHVFCPAHFVLPIQSTRSLRHTILWHGRCSFLTYLAG